MAQDARSGKRRANSGNGETSTSNTSRISVASNPKSRQTARSQSISEAGRGKPTSTTNTQRPTATTSNAIRKAPSLSRRTTSKSGAGPSTATVATPRNEAAQDPSPTEASATSPSIDSLQLASQVYAWQYMTSDLKNSLKKAEKAAHDAIQAKSRELSEEEAGIADQRVRFETERLIAFYEELSKDDTSAEIAQTTQALLRNERECRQISEEALRLSNLSIADIDYRSPLKPFNDALAEIDEEITTIQHSLSSIIKCCPQPSSHLKSVFEAFLPILQSRKDNNSTSRALLITAKDNFSAALRAESERLYSS